MLDLPRRRNRPPLTSRTLPHRQLDQWPAPEMQRRLIAECLRLPDVRPRQSRMAPPGTIALWLPAAIARASPEAYIDQHEFCHLHELPDATVHLTLPEPMRRAALERGWGERHLLAGSALSGCLVMIYSPRDEEELETVLGLIVMGRSFAAGVLAPSSQAALA
jgi:hypothetical protein